MAMLFSWFVLRDMFEGRGWRIVFAVSMFVDFFLWAGTLVVIGYLAAHGEA